MEDQILIQFPDELCEQIAKGIDSGKLPPINLRPVNHDDNSYQRQFELLINGNKYPTKLMDLPCIIESQKTYNKNLYFKTGDISQMLIVDELNNDNNNDHDNNNNDDPNRYIMDSGITPPSKDIRERWSHVRPICHCNDVEVNELCKNCHNIPHALIEKVSKELYNRMHRQASEEWELIPIETEIEVTDDEESDDDIQMMDNKQLMKKQKRDEWEQSDDEDNHNDNRNKMKTNINRKPQRSQPRSQQRQRVNSNLRVKSERNNSMKRENKLKAAKDDNLKRPSSVRSNADNNNKKKSSEVVSNSMNRQRPKTNSMNRQKLINSKTRTTPLLSQNSLPRPPSSTRSRGGFGSGSMMKSPSILSSAQPPLNFMSDSRTPNMTLSNRNTPMLLNRSFNGNNVSSSNLIKVNKKVNDNKNNEEKKRLETTIIEKKAELKEKENKLKKQNNRMIKKKLKNQIEKLTKEIAQIEAKIKSIA